MGNEGAKQGLFSACFVAWVKWVETFKKDAEMAAAVKAARGKLKDFQDKQSRGAKSVLQRMTNSNNSALIQSTFRAWMDLFFEDRKASEFEEQLAQKNAGLGDFKNRNSGAAMSASKRSALVQEESQNIIMFNLWKREARIEAVRRRGKESNSKRKQELQGVKGLFKNFANELGSSLKEGTPRIDAG